MMDSDICHSGRFFAFPFYFTNDRQNSQNCFRYLHLNQYWFSSVNLCDYRMQVGLLGPHSSDTEMQHVPSGQDHAVCKVKAGTATHRYLSSESRPFTLTAYSLPWEAGPQHWFSASFWRNYNLLHYC